MNELEAPPVEDPNMPPFDMVAEQSVLGAAMLSKTVLDEIQSIVSAGDFYVPKHELVWEAIGRLVSRLQPVDVVTVSGEIATMGKLGLVGNGAYVHELTAILPTAANGGFYAGIVHELAVRRRLIEVGTRIVQKAQSREGEIAEVLDDSARDLASVSGEQRQGTHRIGDAYDGLVARLDSPAPDFTPTPWSELNALIGGVGAGELIVVAARPGGGKSLLGLQLAAELARSGAVSFSALEMGEQALLTRLLSAIASVPGATLKRKQLTSSEWKAIAQAQLTISDLPLHIDDRPMCTVAHVKAVAREVARIEGNIAGVFVDYLQLMAAPHPGMKAHEAVDENAKALKGFAREMNVPVVVLSQMNRDPAKPAFKRKTDNPEPQLGLERLSASDGIGMHADTVLMLQRREISGVPSDELGVHVVKQRNGRQGSCTLKWEAAYSRLRSLQADHLWS